MRLHTQRIDTVYLPLPASVSSSSCQKKLQGNFSLKTRCDRTSDPLNADMVEQLLLELYRLLNDLYRHSAPSNTLLELVRSR